MGSTEVTVEKSTALSFNWIYAVVSAAALAIFGVGLYLALLNPGQWTMLAAGCISMVAVGVTWPIAHAMAAGRASQTAGELLAQQLHQRLEHIVVGQ